MTDFPIPFHMQTTADQSRLRFIKLAEVMHRTALSKSAIYERIKSKTFPASIPLDTGPAVAWLESEIDEWIAERVRKARGEMAAA